MAAIKYEWTKTFETDEEAIDVAAGFHEALRGNDDYIESRIILNVTENVVTLTEFSDSDIHVHVDDTDSQPVLEIFRKVG